MASATALRLARGARIHETTIDTGVPLRRLTGAGLWVSWMPSQGAKAYGVGTNAAPRGKDPDGQPISPRPGHGPPADAPERRLVVIDYQPSQV